MTELLILILANYAISRTVAKEDGPFEVFKRWRDFLGDAHLPNEPTTDDETEWDRYNEQCDRIEQLWRRSIRGTVAGVFSCPFCLAWYSALFVLGLSIVGGGLYQSIPVAYLAIVGGSNFLQSIEEK